MRKFLLLLLSASLAACGGGGAGDGASACSTCQTGSTIPVGGFNGTAFDGLIINGTVKVFDFSTGSKGALIGQASTDSLGLYSVSLQVESRPVLIEITGGYYVEEASNSNTSLTTTHKLTALANYATGSNLRVAVTTYSHIAAGLASFLIAGGTPVSSAIDQANQRASSLAGVNILTTIPKEITNVTNASATLTPELKYGFLAGAISQWTYSHAPSGSSAHLAPYTSIDFAQLAYDDVAADGLLDGLGKDSAGSSMQLSFGTTPLGPNVYRRDLGTAMVQIAAHSNNKTGLDGVKLLPFAQSYIGSTDPMFAGVAPTPFAVNTVSIPSPAAGAWLRKNIAVVPAITSPFGVKKVELLIDGVVSQSVADAVPASFSIDSTQLADGARSFSVRLTDVGGRTTTQAVTLNIDNTAPALASMFQTGGVNFYVLCYASPSLLCAGIRGIVVDSMPASVALVGSGLSLVPQAGVEWKLGAPSNLIGIGSVVRITDAAGNCSDYTSASVGTWAAVSLNVCP